MYQRWTILIRESRWIPYCNNFILLTDRQSESDAYKPTVHEHRWVKMKQPDVVVSPPAFVWDPYLTLTHVTSDLDPRDLCSGFCSLVMIFFLVDFFLVNYFLVTDRQTESDD